MGRCEGYYKLENRRCDREAMREVRAADGEHYSVCEYHRRQVWTAMVARWHGETGLRKTLPTGLRPAAEPRVLALS
jgi:hypothetical protein